MNTEFMECDECSSKTGSTPLCQSCRHNRSIIQEQGKVIAFIEKGVNHEWLQNTDDGIRSLISGACLAGIRRIITEHRGKVAE
jgi:hypothetical protein